MIHSDLVKSSTPTFNPLTVYGDSTKLVIEIMYMNLCLLQANLKNAGEFFFMRVTCKVYTNTTIYTPKEDTGSPLVV